MSQYDSSNNAMLPYLGGESLSRMFYNLGYVMLHDDKHDIGKFSYYNVPHRYHGRIEPHHPSALHHWPVGIGFMVLGQIGGMMSKIQETMTTITMDENGITEVEELSYMGLDENNDGEIDHEQYQYHYANNQPQEEDEPIYLNQQQQQSPEIYQYPQRRSLQRSHQPYPKALPLKETAINSPISTMPAISNAVPGVKKNSDKSIPMIDIPAPPI